MNILKIADLKQGMSNVELEAEIASVGDVREINKYGRSLRVENIMLKDDSGTIQMSLWNENIDKVKEGDKVHIKNAYINTFRDNIQVTLGRSGTIEVVE